MIECIFTIDYEIYGNGEGTLRELVFEPARKLEALFDRFDAKFVVFVEVAELQTIATLQSDAAIPQVERQIKEFYDNDFEIALHLHPQWYNARFEKGRWILDYDEYNLCTLPNERIAEIIEAAITYLRGVIDAPDFSPVSFRAGNWLLQPTAAVAAELTKYGVKIDSSVFKGGRRQKLQHRLDYSGASENGYFWRFGNDVTVPDRAGRLLEIPIYTTMVPWWKMMTTKRVSLEHRRVFNRRNVQDRLRRLLDVFHLRHPLKFDFCRMTLEELIEVADRLIEEDRLSPERFKPIVAIGHTKDLLDFNTIEAFLSYLRSKEIRISTLAAVAGRCYGESNEEAPLPVSSAVLSSPRLA